MQVIYLKCYKVLTQLCLHIFLYICLWLVKKELSFKVQFKTWKLLDLSVTLCKLNANKGLGFQQKKNVYNNLLP